MTQAIERLAQLHGVADSFVDYRGESRDVSLETRTAILNAMGVLVAGDESAQKYIAQLETAAWTHLAPPVLTSTVGERITVPIATPRSLGARTLEWTIKLENGQQRHGVMSLSQLEVLEHADVEGREYSRLAAPLPELPPGDHRVALTLDTGLSTDVRVVVAPQRCFEPPAITQGRKLWGLAVQLYTLRSQRNWGMGDFRDLRELIEAAAPRGCAIIGLNPLHALMPGNPAHVSPYSPSSRLFLNVLYISVEDVEELAQNEPLRAFVASAGFQSRLRALREPTQVNYVDVAAAKFEVLQQLYAQFRTRHLQTSSPRAAAFRAFVEAGGDPLMLHATYDALDAHWRLQGPQYWGWPSWPEEYRDPTSLAVNRFMRERQEDIEYFLYLQWLAHEQLRAAQGRARELGMAIGLYGDVAVGANSAGSETWSNHRLYLQDASVGAPPDPLALKGQDWGIPPQHPQELKTQQYRPFTDLIRNNMQAVGGLRLDHVMTLYRLWWVPRGLSSKEGAYVHYPLDDLMRILALESQRQRCLVIGEDLGTVPEAMLRAMERYGAYHYKVLLFEQRDNGEFKAPSDYVQHALATVTTHDLPTLRAWWEARDVALREALDLYPSDAMRAEARQVRERERVELLLALDRARVWRWRRGDPLPPYAPALSRAVHAFLGLSNANIAMVQLEDLIGMTEPVNVPGTDGEYPNWRRKITVDTAEIFASPDAQHILEGLHMARQGRNPNQD